MRATSPRHWAHLVLVVALALGIAALAQAISERHSVRWDLTPTRIFTLSDTSRKVLGLLKGPISALAFTSREASAKTADVLKLFQSAAPNFQFELLELDRFPGRAREAGIDRYGKAQLRVGDRKVVVDATREQTIAAGLLFLARGRPTRVGFLTGHGERDLSDTSAPTGYGQARQALGQESYEIGALGLLQAKDVPDGVDLVVVAGPKNDLLEAESQALDRYLARGGHVLLLLDPVPLPTLERFARRHGIEVPLDIVTDRSNQIMGSDPFTIPVPSFRPHEMTASSSTPGLFAVARSVVAAKGDEGARVVEVAQSYPEAWAMRDFERAGQLAAPDESRDRRGPISLVAAASWRPGSEGEARVVVAGDSDFASNAFLDLLGNRDLFLNAVSWLTSAGELVAARPPSEMMALRPLSPMVLSQRSGRALFLALVVLEPALVLAFGTFLAVRRRWQG